MPQGLILRAFAEETYMEPQRDGTNQKVKRYKATGEQFVIKGVQTASAGQAFAANPAVRELLPGGFALTYGVPKGLWDNWLHHNRNSQIVKRGVIFAMPSMQAATEEAKKHADTKSGLEPVDQANPGARMPGGQSRAERQLKVEMLETGGPDTSPR